MNRRFIFLICLLASASLPGTGATAASVSLPERLTGVWVGGGSIYKAPGTPLERVRCRFSSKWAKKSQTISLRYICLGIDIKFETTGTLKYSAETHAINGKLVTVGIGGFRASGKNTGNNVVINLTGKDKKTGKPVSGVLSIQIKGKTALSSSLTATDPKTGKRFKAFSASFKR